MTTPSRRAMDLALGPLLYFWPREQVFRFYAAVADWPVAVVYLGETVCGRRRELRLDDLLAIGAQLAAAGKRVVLSTQELLESDADLRGMHAVVDNGRFLVEANDMAAVRRLAGRQAFVAGPFLNVYNADTLALLVRLGAQRWVAPVELSGEGIAAVQAQLPSPIDTEIFAYGRLPLAVSARCFTARYHNLVKDRCEFRCLDHPDGLEVETRDGGRFLSMNGVQTQSARVQNLLPLVDELGARGVTLLRLSPQARDMEAVVRLFRATLDGELAPPAANVELAALLPAPACDGYWHGQAGMLLHGAGGSP